jgi:hypothetical protein
LAGAYDVLANAVPAGSSPADGSQREMKLQRASAREIYRGPLVDQTTIDHVGFLLKEPKMGETIFRVALADIESVRVKCRSCGWSYETPLSAIGSLKATSKCHGCDRPLWNNLANQSVVKLDEPFWPLQTAFNHLVEQQGMTLEFVVPSSAIK